MGWGGGVVRVVRVVRVERVVRVVRVVGSADVGICKRGVHQVHRRFAPN